MRYVDEAENKLRCWLERPTTPSEKAHKLGSGSTKLEWIHDFGRTLPYNWFIWLLSFLPLINKKTAVIRRYDYRFCCDENPINQQEDYFEIRVGRYPKKNLSVTIEFKKPIEMKQITGNVIRAHTMEKVLVSPMQGEPRKFEIKIKTIRRDERLRISWPLQRT